MSSVPMPRDLSEEAVAEWLIDASGAPSYGAEMMRDPVVRALWTPRARAVRALLREKVREAITATRVQERRNDFTDDDEIVSRVLGEEAPRA